MYEMNRIKTIIPQILELPYGKSKTVYTIAYDFVITVKDLTDKEIMEDYMYERIR